MRTTGRFPVPAATRLTYKELRSKTVLTVLGPVELTRPYYLCAHCSKGQYPADAELGVAGLESSPGVRRMQAVVGSEMPFAPACEPMKLLAGLDVNAKATSACASASNAPPRPSARRSLSGTSRKSVAPNNSSCPWFPNRTFRKCMC
jgi:hypothetical protein